MRSGADGARPPQLSRDPPLAEGAGEEVRYDGGLRVHSDLLHAVPPDVLHGPSAAQHLCDGADHVRLRLLPGRGTAVCILLPSATLRSSVC